MAIPAQFDEHGRLVALVPHSGDVEMPSITLQAVLEATETIADEVGSEVIPPSTKRDPTIAECRAFFEKFKDLYDWAEGEGLDGDCVYLVLLGFLDQRISFATRVFGSRFYWVSPRVKTLRRMGMWVGDNHLGERFGRWLDTENEHYELNIILDLLEMEGVVLSKFENGEYLWQATEATMRNRHLLQA